MIPFLVGGALALITGKDKKTNKPTGLGAANTDIELLGFPYVSYEEEKQLGKTEEVGLGKAVSTNDIYQMITDKMLAMIKEASGKGYKKKWQGNVYGKGYLIPFNYVSKKRYRGVNHFLLTSFEPLENPFFLTFKQIEKLGDKLKKGSLGNRVIYFTKLYKIEDPEKDVDFGSYNLKKVKTKSTKHGIPESDITYIPILKYYNIFNGKDIEGIDFDLENFKKGYINKPLPPTNKMPVPEAILKNYPKPQPKLGFGGDRAYYQPAADAIQMPYMADFETAQDYYRTLLHEYAHSTGIAKRLNREMGGKKGSKKYAFEELVAEWGATFLSAEAGIIFHTNTNHAEYLKNWNQVLTHIKDDNKFIMRACSKAQELTDFILVRDTNGNPKYYKDIKSVVSKNEKQEQKVTGKIERKKKRSRTFYYPTVNNTRIGNTNYARKYDAQKVLDRFLKLHTNTEILKLIAKHSKTPTAKFLETFNKTQKTKSLTLEENQSKDFVENFFKEIYKRNLKSKKIFVSNLDYNSIFNISDLEKSKAPKLRKTGVDSLKSVVSKDDLRPIMTGVFTDQKDLVATNAHILVILKGKGKKANNGKTLNAFNIIKHNSKYLEGTYPKYKNVIPNYKNKSEFIDIDKILNDVYTLLKLTRPIKTMLIRFVIKDSGNLIAFDANYFYTVLRVLKANGATKVRYAVKKKRALILETNNNNLGLAMPIFTGSNDIKDIAENFIVNQPINYSNKGYNDTTGYGLKGGNISQPTLFSTKQTSKKIPKKTTKNKVGLGFSQTQTLNLTESLSNVPTIAMQPEPTKEPPAEGVFKEVTNSAEPSTVKTKKPKKGVVNSNELMGMQFDSLNFQGEWAKFMQEPAKNMRIAIWGKPKNGKTAGATKLANYLTSFGNVLYNFADQGFNKSTKDLWQLSGLSEKPNAYAVATRELDELDKLCASGDYQFVFIDMINTYIHRTGIKYFEFEDRFLKKYPNISFILVFEVTKSGDFKGDQGWTHLVDAVVTVDSFVMENQGRYGVGHYVVWKEGLQKTNPKKYNEFIDEAADLDPMPSEIEITI